MYRKAFFAICLNGFALAFTWGITVTNIPWLFDRVGIKETDLGIWFTIFAVQNQKILHLLMLNCQEE